MGGVTGATTCSKRGPSPTVLPVLSFSFPFLPVAGLKSRYITAGGVTPGNFFGKLRAIWCILETFLHSSIHLGFATLANITFLIFRSMDDITKSQIGVGPSISVYCYELYACVQKTGSV